MIHLFKTKYIFIGGDWHGTDSDVSADDVPMHMDAGKDDHPNTQRSPKPNRKYEKDEKNKELKQDKASERRLESGGRRDNRDNYTPR